MSLYSSPSGAPLPQRSFSLLVVLAVGGLIAITGACAATGRSVPDGFDEGASSSSGSTGGTGASGGPGLAGGFGNTDSAAPASQCNSTLQVTFRDFNESHPDFEWGIKHEGWTGDIVRAGLVAPTLGPDQKPVFLSNSGCGSSKPPACDWPGPRSVITSKETFDQWYRTVPGTNYELPKTLELVETRAGSGKYVFDSSAFFPLGTDEGFGVTPAGNSLGKNFLFTTEIHLKFGYEQGQKFTFRGDDDLWIFVNGKLAMDLGSLHSPYEGTIDFDAQASTLGITPNNTYAMDIFHAERQTSGSNFHFETNIRCFESVVVK